jgi:uncharacterized membrane protein YhhN
MLMKKQVCLLLYFITLAVDIFAVTYNLTSVRTFSKPLLMVFLAAYLIIAVYRIRPAIFRNLLLAALLFSWVGDILLLRTDQEAFFLYGLGSFLLAHLAYIWFFLKVRYTNYPLPACKYFYIFLAEAVVIAFLFVMFPYLDDMSIPVIVYAVVISFTLLCIMHAFRFREQPMGWYCITGGILFICSDAMIAVDQFYRPFPFAEISIMVTYGLAQWCLIEGSTRYLNSRVKA